MFSWLIGYKCEHCLKRCPRRFQHTYDKKTMDCLGVKDGLELTFYMRVCGKCYYELENRLKHNEIRSHESFRTILEQ